MKMKNLYIALLAFTVLFSSCSDFLDVESRTDKSTVNYYKNAADAEEALVGCYDALQLLWAGGVALPVASVVMSDLCFGSTGAGDDDKYPMIDEFDKEVSSGNLSMYEDNWKAYYQGVYRCNMLIQNLENIDWEGDDDLQKSVTGEVYFLRAFLYFDMVRMWEKIPLLTVPSRETIEQSDPEDTYAVIASDLKLAIENCSDVQYSAIGSSWHGHATTWAAKSLLARVFLYYTGYYNKTSFFDFTKDDVLAHLEEVIVNSGYDLLPDSMYYALWPAASTYQAVVEGGALSDSKYAGETNQEVIFAVKYTYTSDYNGNTDGNHWMVMQGIRGASNTKYGYGEGWGSSTVVPSFYENWDENDLRKAASIIAIEEEGVDYTAANIKDVKEYTGYYTKKYTPQCDSAGNSIAYELGGVNFMISQYQDYFVLRFADVLLMAAELGSSNAVEYVNRVRNRAGLEDVAAVDKDVIYQERKYEFAFEGIWYWDLLRYDSTLEYAANAVSFEGTVMRGGVETEKVIDGANLIKTRGLFQIPYNQITLSGNKYEQNPGW